MKKQIDNIVEWMRKAVEEAGAKGVLFGLSGGIDSAVVAGLAKKAFPENSLGLILPCESHLEDEEHARIVAEHFNLDTKKIDLTDTYRTLVEAIAIDFKSDLAMTNIKPRLRMTSLYALGQELNYLVLGPTNKSEFVLGYFTKHADSGVDLLPIVDFVKRDVYKMAEIFEIPSIIIQKKPSAGLAKNQTDEEDLGISYDEIDDYIEKDIASKEIKEKVDTMFKRSEHKRQYAKIYRK